MAEVIVVMAKGIGINSWLKCCFTSTETIGLLGTGTLDVHLDFHTAPELCTTATANRNTTTKANRNTTT